MDVLMVEVIQSTVMAAHCRGGMGREIYHQQGGFTSMSLGVLQQHTMPPDAIKHFNPSIIMINYYFFFFG